MVIHGYMACLSVREDGVEISPISYEVGKLNADKRSYLVVCFLFLVSYYCLRAKQAEDATVAMKRMHE